MAQRGWPRRRLVGSVLLAGLTLAAAPQALAHGRSEPGGPTSGIAIPSLTHGQMAVIADNRAAIMALAADQFPTDPIMRRLQGFIALQAFACAWGLVPGSSTDEGSPYNECSHAYLAATQALLLHLGTMPGRQDRVGALARTIEREMVLNGASLVLCRFSDEPFNTADLITPHLGAVPVDPLTLGEVGAALTAAGWLAGSVLPRRRRAAV